MQKVHRINEPQRVRKGQPQISIEKQVLLCVWYLANLESIRSVAQRFGITKSTAWTILRRVGNWMLAINRQFKIISWPSEEKALETANIYQNINGFPGVIGCIDGTHIKILAPKENPNSYFNRKKFHSIVLQAVCNEKKMFTDVFAGIPGSCHDSRVFQMSDLSERIRNNTIQFPNNTHLVGDLAYPLSKTMMVGFKEYGNLTARHRNFNVKLSQIRVSVEQSFASLKGRFRRLKYIETVRMDLICLHVVVACILHNICILNGDNPDDIFNLPQEMEEERIGQEVEEPQNVEQIRREAVFKRNNIMNNLLF